MSTTTNPGEGTAALAAEFTVGAKVRRTRGRFAGTTGIVASTPDRAVCAIFHLTGDHYLARLLHPSEVEVIDAGPFPIPAHSAAI